MNSTEIIEYNNLWIKAKKKAIDNIDKCFYPGCEEKSIKSHILQRNGILSPLIEDGHLYQMEINLYKEPINYFVRTGAGEAFSFNCFCNIHDNQLFKPIETHPIDFSLYRNRLLFLVRAKLNEKFRKMVVIDIWSQLIDFYKRKGDHYIVNDLMAKKLNGQQGLSDILMSEQVIWNDLDSGSESFVIEFREIEFLPICLASFFDHETTDEINRYRELQGKDMEKLSSIFITVFPYNKKSIIMLAYRQSDEKILKGYVNKYLKESEKKLQRLITNLMLFQCETWVMSEDFFLKRIHKCQDFFHLAAKFSYQNNNERRNFDLNMFREGFCEKTKTWENLYTNY
ncbi:MAG TPA: hypothetical protein PK904_17810 [Bacteroidales bacterium]|nr:hypothetical protein [Bacteroidales bacterium]